MPVVAPFAFPDGLEARAMRRTESRSGLHEVLFSSLDQLESGSNSFVVLITGAQHLLYGMCVVKDEPISLVRLYTDTEVASCSSYTSRL